jgi:hypothetical protein
MTLPHPVENRLNLWVSEYLNGFIDIETDRVQMTKQ